MNKVEKWQLLKYYIEILGEIWYTFREWHVGIHFTEKELFMIVKPKARGFLCATAHPKGCEAHVKKQIDYVKKEGKINGPKKVLIIGSSTGFGLASRIVSTFANGAATIGLAYEKPSIRNKTASAGWYNTAAFEKFAHEEGYYAKSINGDAFSNEIKEQTIKMIKEDLGKVDLVIYSLAAPKRVHPVTGEQFRSVLKPLDKAYRNKTVDVNEKAISMVEIEPATQEEAAHTVAVMGGEDWEMWLSALNEADALEKDAITVAYSYIGPELTHAIYHNGTIGKAKEHLDKTAESITNKFSEQGVKAYVSVNKALVTQASSAIPVVPLYISVLFKVMKEKGIHEGCIEQIYRLYQDRLYEGSLQLDEEGRIRIDDLEMREDVQEEVHRIWENINEENLDEVTDLEGYRKDFFQLFGFELENVDYEEDIDINVNIPSIT